MRAHPLVPIALLLAATFARPAAADEPSKPAQAAGSAVDEQAAAWLAKGNKAFKEGQFAEAEAAYREAWSIKKGYDIAGNLGAAELAQGKLKQAAQHLAFTLRQFPVTGSPALRERMQKAYDQCRAGVGAVRVTVEPRGAMIRVDGEAHEAPLADEVFVDPGEHTIEASFAGYTAATQRVRVEAGAAAEITLTLAPIPKVDPRRSTPPKRRDLIPGLGLGAVSLVGIVGGAAFLSMASTRRSEAAALSKSIVGDHRSCVDGAANYDTTRCSSVQDDARAYATFHNVAVGSFIAGGLAAAGTAAYFLWPTKQRGAASPNLRVMPVFGARDGGVILSGEF